MALNRWQNRIAFVLLVAGIVIASRPAGAVPTESKVADLTIRQGEIPRRLAGYGLVVGLDGTGDRSFGGVSHRNPTVHSVINLLRRFHIEIPSEYLYLRNVAAVLVTAEVSPFLRAGGRFKVQVSALGDATSLRGGTLWITPLVTDPDQPPVGTAQGSVYIEENEASYSPYAQRGNSGRIPEGGILEVDPSGTLTVEPRLLLRRPDLSTASRITKAVNAAFGEGTAAVLDPGAVGLTHPEDQITDLSEFLAAVDTVTVMIEGPSRIVISGRTGTVVAGGEVRIGSAVINHQGITLQIGGTSPGAEGSNSRFVGMEPSALVQDVASGLQAAGATPGEIAAIFEALQAAGALNAELMVR
jgi:flagellar P-ring protein precursor FlgI